MIERLSDAGIPVDRACRVLGVARQNYYLARRAPTTSTQLRRQWLTGLIREVHVASRGTYVVGRLALDRGGPAVGVRSTLRRARERALPAAKKP